MVSSEEKALAIVSHLAPLIGYSVILGQVLIPLVIYLWKGKESDYVREHALESLNFQISMLIYLVLSGLLMFVLIGFILMPVVAILGFVFMIMATIKAANDEHYSYPLSIRFVK